MRALTVALAGYVASYVLALALGIVPRLPWMFFPMLALVYLPSAWVLVMIGRLLDRRLAGDPRLLVATALVIGTVVAVWWRVSLVWPVALAATPWATRAAMRGELGPAAAWPRHLAVLFLGYAAVWNLNYVAALVRPDVHDATLLAIDRAIWEGLFGWGGTPHLYPIVRAPAVIAALQTAYLLLFAEVFVVLAVLGSRGVNVDRFLAATFGCYAAGVACFLVYPVVGPPLAHFPAAYDLDALGVSDYGAIVLQWVDEYRAARIGRPVNGFGYFVGLPSLHVAMACWFQLALRASPVHFWLFLPINVLMTAATFLLGYHYVLDAPAGVVLALFVHRLTQPTKPWSMKG